MGQKKSRYAAVPPLDHVVIRRITRATSLLSDEIQYFYHDFLKYAPTGYLTLSDFEKCYQLLFRNGSPEKFAKYVFDVYDTNQDQIVDFEEFTIGFYYTTKASSTEKILWAFDLCDQDNDHQLDVNDLENIIQALYELSDADMSRMETCDEAIGRVRQLFINQDDSTNDELFDIITESKFVNIVQNDRSIMKLLDCRSMMNKRMSKVENSANLFKKHLKFKFTRSKSLSDSKLAATKQND